MADAACRRYATSPVPLWQHLRGEAERTLEVLMPVPVTTAVTCSRGGASACSTVVPAKRVYRAPRPWALYARSSSGGACTFCSGMGSPVAAPAQGHGRRMRSKCGKDLINMRICCNTG